jgi:Spy/CpxP family protein refolding chaperone
MKKIAIIGVLLLALAVIVGGVMAQGRGKGPGPGMGQGMNQPMNCQQYLGLNQAQVAEMQRLNTAFQNDTADLRTQLQTKQQEMAQLWAAADPSLRRIKAKAGEMDQIRARIRDRAIDLHYTIVTQVLTPEQRAKCAECCKSGQCGMGCGMGAGVCPMGPGAGMGPGACGMGMGPVRVHARWAAPAWVPAAEWAWVRTAPAAR